MQRKQLKLNKKKAEEEEQQRKQPEKSVFSIKNTSTNDNTGLSNEVENLGASRLNNKFANLGENTSPKYYFGGQKRSQSTGQEIRSTLWRAPVTSLRRASSLGRNPVNITVVSPVQNL